MIENTEGPEKLKRVEMPTTLDVVSIDGNWGQIVAISIDAELTIRWLSDNTMEHVNLKDYKLEKIDSDVAGMKEQFKKEEIENIYYDSEHPELKAKVTVFGKYTRDLDLASPSIISP